MKLIRWGNSESQVWLKNLFLRREKLLAQSLSDVLPICDLVRREGDKALLSLTKKFDGVSLSSFEPVVPRRGDISIELRKALEAAADRIKGYHKAQPVERTWEMGDSKERLGMRVLPLKRVGVYAPGGRALYPSSVLMSVIPAKIAGVEEVIICSPALLSGGREREILLEAAFIAGASVLFPLGGAQAIAAMAYGTESIPRVEKIVGPGNRFVAAAKHALSGMVGIDMIAGPTEVLIFADQTAKPSWVAADLIAQAEHDSDAQAILITTSEELGKKVLVELDRQLLDLPRREIANQSLQANGAVVAVSSLAEGADLCNQLAPEHLELQLENPRGILPLLNAAGALFIGDSSSEAIGDYVAGPSHVLPTGGTARFASPLGVHDFLRRTSVIEISSERVRELAKVATTLARAEGLEGHARSIEQRVKDREILS